MSIVAVTNEAYEIKQGKNVVLLNDGGTVTIEAKYKDRTNWVALVTGSTDASFTIPFMKEAEFRISSQNQEVTFDYSPYF